jgi:hypothetical protein
VTDLSTSDLVLLWLNRGRDGARTIGDLAETLKLPRRQVEEAVQTLRLAEWPVCSGPEGMWLGDSADLLQTLASLRGRLRSQYATYRALRRALARLSDSQQTTLWKTA